MKVEFLIDILSRDLPTACLLDTALSGNGDQLIITSTFVGDGEKRSTLMVSARESADVLITPWYNSRRTFEILARARGARAHLVHLPSEQFFSGVFDHEKFNVNSGKSYSRQVSAVFVWGQYYARRLVEDMGFPRERVFEVGSPRLESVRRIQGVAGDRDFSKTPLRILFISDFPLADLDTESRRKKFTRVYKADITARDVEQLVDERRYMLETARRVSELDGYEVRVRPHPGEKLNDYHLACENTNVQLANPDKPFSDDLLWSDVAVGYTTTSVFEVAVAGRPFFSLRKKRPPDVTWREGLEKLYRVCTAEQLISAIADPAVLEEAGRELATQAEFYVGNVNGTYDSLAALCSALHHPALVTEQNLIDGGLAAIGALRSMGKYLAFRLFSSDVWNAVGGWQPAPVKRRLTAGYALTDESISEALEAWGTLPNKGSKRPVSWELSDWSWRPVVAADPD